MTTDLNERVWDVIVIGAGPAGALSALLAARSGASTLLVERKRFPRSKVCGGCLNLAALNLLESLGLGDIALKYGQPIRRLRLGRNARRLSIHLPGGVAIARTDLDAELVRHAQEAGAVFLQEMKAVLGKVDGQARIVSLSTGDRTETIRGKVVIVASGLGGGTLGEKTTFKTRVAPGSRIGTGCIVRDYPDDYQAGEIAMAIGRSGYVGLTPTLDGLEIASALDSDFLKRQGGPARAAAAILDEAGFPAVPSMVEADWSGTLPLTRTTRPVAADRVFLVGDSAGYVEPFTGQGMAIALQGAFALSTFVNHAIAGWSPSLEKAWSREYSRNVGSRHRPAAFVAAIARRPALTGLAFAILSILPAFSGLIVRAVNRPVILKNTLS